MQVLLTGAFGNISESTLLALFEKNHQITCFDIKTSKNEKKASELAKRGSFKLIWGNITDPDAVNSAIEGIDCILHLAGIIPPMSELNPTLSYRVNVEGTRNLINAAEKVNPKPKIIFTSSISVHGPRMSSPPPRRADEPLNPTDNYTHSKVACEKLLQESTLQWTIFRLGASPSLDLMNFGLADALNMIYSMPLDQRVEFVHTRDVGMALANAVTSDISSKILLIGGGKKCQMLNRQFLQKTLEACGLGMPSDWVFRIPTDDQDWYYTDWMDTEEAQKFLQFQNTSFEDYVTQLREKMGLKIYFIKLMSPWIKWYLKWKSPYYKENKIKSSLSAQ